MCNADVCVCVCCLFTFDALTLKFYIRTSPSSPYQPETHKKNNQQSLKCLESSHWLWTLSTKVKKKLNSNWDWHLSLLPHEEETRESWSCRDDHWDFHQTNVIINPWIKRSNRFALLSDGPPSHCCSDRLLQTPHWCLTDASLTPLWLWSFSGVADMMLAGFLLLPLLTLTGKKKRKEKKRVEVRLIFVENV